MLNKYFLVEKVVNSLEKNQFDFLFTRGCFDIVARREKLFLLKILLNIDGLNAEQAQSLKVASYFLSAQPFIISLKTNREFLKDGVVYSRFGLPIITQKFFENILAGEMFAIQSSKGKYTVPINTEILRKRRKELNLTLEKLSKIVGISKKALYEIENKRVDPMFTTVRKLETVLNVNLRAPYKMKSYEPIYLKPKDSFQEKISNEFLRIGIENSPISSAPFKIVGKKDFCITVYLSKNTAQIKKVDMIKKTSSLLSSRALFVTKNLEKDNIDGVPVISESELSEIDSTDDFIRIIKEKEAQN